ncbi:MAG: hypothetical protein A2156_09270 [Deltaproteobacteria bacterium RBG_16_48_10]|nr:MAG: hypothetical protein A2156_09270 [Deltaproteobacteria bacterium RBG_16_48_10]
MLVSQKSKYPCFFIPAKAVLPKAGQIHMFLVPCIRRDNVWTPAGVYPLQNGAGVTAPGLFTDSSNLSTILFISDHMC